LTILVGLSCDFGLHLAESYAQSPLTHRKARAMDSVQRMGTPICSAALTTVMGVLPMCFSTLQILARFAIIIPINMVLAILFGLHFFTPMLMLVGPEPHDEDPEETRPAVASLRRAWYMVMGSAGRRLCVFIVVFTTLVFSYEPALEIFKDNPNTGVGVISTSVLLAVGLLLFEYTPDAEKLKGLSESFKGSFRRTLSTNTSTPRQPTVEEPSW